MSITHGCTRHGRPTTEWLSWKSMKARCFNKRNKSFKYYGGRGISVCKEWLGDSGFANFLRDLGKKPTARHSLGRINNDLGYCKANCRWEEPRQQLRNRTITRFLECRGKRLCVCDWALLTGIRPDTIAKRLDEGGWSVEQALGFAAKPSKPGRLIHFRGESHNMADWGRILGLDGDLIECRLNKLGWTVEKALSTPRRRIMRNIRARNPQSSARQG